MRLVLRLLNLIWKLGLRLAGTDSEACTEATEPDMVAGTEATEPDMVAGTEATEPDMEAGTEAKRT